MACDVFLNHIFRDVACTPGTVANGPEMVAPVAFFELRKFLLQMVGRSSLERFHDVAYREFWRIFDVHVDMIDAHRSFEDLHILGVTDLDENFPAAWA